MFQSEIPEKWRAKALSEVDPSSRDTVRLKIPLQIIITNSIHSDTNCLDVITETLISAFWMTIQVGRSSPARDGVPERVNKRLILSSEGDYYDLQLVPERYTGY